MRAAVLHGVGNLRIEEVPEPDPNDANVMKSCGFQFVHYGQRNGNKGDRYAVKRQGLDNPRRRNS